MGLLWQRSAATKEDEPELRVYMLGPPRVTWTGCPLDIPRRQVRAILYRLATQLTPIPREHLCYLFWPDTSECAARRNLSHLLTHLRNLLPVPQIFLITDDYIALDPRRVWSDVVAFDQLYFTLRGTHLGLNVLEQAVGFYQGSFLAGFSLPTSPEFELWADLERGTRERCYLELLAKLVETYTAQENHHTAIDYAQCYLTIDNLAEEMHRRLIALYTAVGDRGAALHQFETCAVILERELGVSPLPETRAAYQAALTGRLLPAPSAVLPPHEWTTLPSLEVPLVGRELALQQLEQAYLAARAGQGGLVLISGEPGIGKSRLLQELATRLATETTIVVGAGYEDERDCPFLPLIEALTPHLSNLDLTLPDIEPLDLAILVALWPNLQTVLPEIPSLVSLEPDLMRGLLFQSLAQLLLSLAVQHPPLLLCLDDLHWADDSTLAWLGYLARQFKHLPILIVGTYRSGEIMAVAVLRTELTRLGRLQEISLTGLSPSEIACLLRHLFGQSGDMETLSQRLHRETGGNPLFLLEWLRYLLEADLVGSGKSGWTFADLVAPGPPNLELSLPDTIGEVVRARLYRLNPQAHQVLEAGAVIGTLFSFELIQAVSGRPESEVVEALETLLAQQFITEDGGSYRFNHDLIRTVVYRDLSYGRRHLLQQRLEEALQHFYPFAPLP